MRRHGSLFALVVAIVCVAAGSTAGAADFRTRVPVDYRAYDSWNAIRAPRLSDDGRYLAYALTPDYGDPTLVIRDLDRGTEFREAHGAVPSFSADARVAVYSIVPDVHDVEAAKRAKKPEAEQPKNGLGIVDLPLGHVTTYARVKSVRVARDGGRFIAFLHDVALKPDAASSPAPATIRSPLPSPSPSAAADAAKKKDDGADLVIRDLRRGQDAVVANVTDYALADDDKHVAYATQTRDGKGDGVHVRDLTTGTVSDVLVGAGRYRGLTVSRDGMQLGFLSDVRNYADPAPHADVYIAPLDRAGAAATLVVAADTAGVPPGTTPNTNATPAFSKDGQRLFFGTAAAPTPVPSGTPVPTAVDLWSYRDLRLQSVQMHAAADDRKQTYRAVYDIGRRTFAQLGSPQLNRIETNNNPLVALGYDERPYAIADSWRGDGAADMYAVSLADGSRRLLARGAVETSLSPGGTYALCWDRASRHWLSIRTGDGKRTILAPHANVTFYDETDDHPAPPPAYGIGGWIAGDRAVIVYDRYDLWLVDPRSGDATNLTHGAGRAARTTYSALETDPERDAFPADEPLLLALSDQRTYASGYARVALSGATPHTLLRVDKLVNGVPGAGLHDRIAPPLRARNASRVVFTQESFRQFRDLWSSDAAFTAPQRVTDANPQLDDYLWGTEELIAYSTPHGIPLRGVLLTPDHFNPRHKYPMLVYFYEKYSDQFHTFYAPVPRYPTIARYVSNGYVVLLPDVTYSVGHPGRSALECILAGVDAVAARGFIDPRRIGIAGHSWAGYQINYMLTQTNRFRAAEAGAAVSNMTSAYGGIRLESGVVRQFQYERGQSRIGATPWDRPDLYLENSGLFGVRNVHTPYLTMHNDADTAVPFEQGVEFITAMRRLGKLAYMFVFNGKEHNLRDTPADRDDLTFWAVHFDEWFDYWLKDAPRPAWFDGVDYLHRGERDVRPLFGEAP